MLLVVWIVVGVLALVVLGVLLHGVQGARTRLAREITAFEREVRPVLDQVASTTERGPRRDGG